MAGKKKDAKQRRRAKRLAQRAERLERLERHAAQFALVDSMVNDGNSGI
ncbi:hypothetical protein ACFOY4_30885 [Actinomadura syzygii]|nr:hypothetical protein [Actinomadura syzygii]